MPKICYVYNKLRSDSLEIIDIATQIIEEYQKQGYNLTLRQLYYQFVARDLIPNTMRNYKRLGDIINNGRLAGLIDWYAIEDRTREVVSMPHWNSVSDIVHACANQYSIDKWEGQQYRPEVWVEKEALAGIVGGVCKRWDISYLSCRGYTSQSEMWKSAQRIRYTIQKGQTPVILHLGDHDPSGIDMTRDIKERVSLLTGLGSDFEVELRRLALNTKQVEYYRLPPNPAKVTDSRYEQYQAEYGSSSWELDALEPSVIDDLIDENVGNLCDREKWNEREAEEQEQRAILRRVADNL